MTTYAVRRIAMALVVVFVVVSLSFFAVRLAPGEPQQLFQNPRIDLQQQEAMRHVFGLDRSLPEQYVRWLGAALRGDWGTSFTYKRPVIQVVARHLPATILLAVATLVIQHLVGLFLGVVAARRPGSKSDHLIRASSLALYAMPQFWLALMALMLLSYKWRIFPPGEMTSIGGGGWIDVLHHLALPASIYGVALAGGLARFTRNSLLEVMGEDYVRTARARGVRERSVLWIHALKNSLNPVVQMLGLTLPALLSGVLIVEVVFSWPGVGRMAYAAILARDYPLVIGTTTMMAIAAVAGTVVADLIQGILDPRVQYE